METATAIPSTKFCWICGRAVSLENGKTDEYGNIVHEECYTARMKLHIAVRAQDNRDAPRRFLAKQESVMQKENTQSLLRRTAEMWPYVLVATSIVGFAYMAMHSVR